MFVYDALLEAFKRWLCVVGAVCVCTMPYWGPSRGGCVL